MLFTTAKLSLRRRRDSRKKPPVVIISDRRAALLPSDPASPGNGALCVRDPAIVACLTALFGNAWDAAIPLCPPPNMSSRERALLKHLADGLTVHTAARKLGISQRTAARDVAALIKMLHANSPFQAGCEAVRRSWVWPESSKAWVNTSSRAAQMAQLRPSDGHRHPPQPPARFVPERGVARGQKPPDTPGRFRPADAVALST
ncbi:MAG: LuxR C-terminal-related transcriptional regulator [Gemmatimonadota bacterium]